MLIFFELCSQSQVHFLHHEGLIDLSLLHFAQDFCHFLFVVHVLKWKEGDSLFAWVVERGDCKGRLLQRTAIASSDYSRAFIYMKVKSDLADQFGATSRALYLSIQVVLGRFKSIFIWVDTVSEAKFNLQQKFLFNRRQPLRLKRLGAAHRTSWLSSPSLSDALQTEDLFAFCALFRTDYHLKANTAVVVFFEWFDGVFLFYQVSDTADDLKLLFGQYDELISTQYLHNLI